MTAKKKSPVVVSVINLKGGVGKTTVTALAARRAVWENGLNVLAIDLDAQANLSQALMTRDGYMHFMEDAEGVPSIVELIDGYRPPTHANPAPTLLDHDAVAQVVSRGAKGRLRVIASRFDFSDRLIGVSRGAAKNGNENVLAQYIAHHASDEDLVLIDCAPTESIFTRMAYHASRYILIPVKTEFFAVIGFPLLKESLSKFKRENATHKIDVCGVLVNNTPKGIARDTARDEISQLAGEYGWEIMKSEMTPAQGYPKLAKSEWSKHVRYKTRWEVSLFVQEILHRVGLPSKWEEWEKEEYGI